MTPSLNPALTPELLPPALRLRVAGLPAVAKGEGDAIILGSAISSTDRDATSGIHASNGCNLVRKEPDGTSHAAVQHAGMEDEPARC